MSDRLAQTKNRPARLLIITLVLSFTALALMSCGAKTTPTPEPPPPQTTAPVQQIPATPPQSAPAQPQTTPELTAPISTTGEITGTGEISQTTLVTIIKSDGSSFTLAPWEFKRISRVKIRVAGKIVNAPTLNEVLKAAGVTSFNQIIITGANTTLTVPREQVTDKMLLDYSANDRLKLILTNLPKEQWIKGVYLIKVE